MADTPTPQQQAAARLVKLADGSLDAVHELLKADSQDSITVSNAAYHAECAADYLRRASLMLTE